MPASEYRVGFLSAEVCDQCNCLMYAWDDHLKTKQRAVIFKCVRMKMFFFALASVLLVERRFGVVELNLKAYTAGQQDAQMLRDICGWLNINSMRAEKVSRRNYSRGDHSRMTVRFCSWFCCF